MRRILVTICIVFSVALGNEYGDYDLRQPDYGQARRVEVDLEAGNSGQENDRVGNSLEDRELSVSAEGDRKVESKESSVTAEDNGNAGFEEPSVTAEDIGNAKSNEPSVIAEDNEDQKYFHPNDVEGKLDEKRYRVELAAGDPTEFRSTNEHYHEPHFYKNLGRRFVPVYPYKVVKEKSKKVQNLKDADLIPRWAPPEVVLAVMKKAIRNRPASKPSDDEDFTRPNILRSGDYWDGVWKEEVKPDNILRTNQNNRHRQTRDEEELNSLPITAKLVPGTKLYDLISGAVRHSPRLVYIINDELNK